MVDDPSTRRRIANLIVGSSITGVVLLSAIVIVLADQNRAQATQLVFSSVLPLLGTWVGTVLAFYFARDNLQAATESTLRLTGRQTSTPVTAVMIRAASFISYDVNSRDQMGTVQLKDVLDKMQEHGFHRMLIRNATGAVLSVIHDSTITAFAGRVNQPIATLDKTVADLLAVDEFKALVEAIGFVAEKATVEETRALMASITGCNDVFVTLNGKPDEAATGWLTNTLLAGLR